MAIDPNILLNIRAPDAGQAIESGLRAGGMIAQLRQAREEAPVRQQLLQQQQQAGDLAIQQQQQALAAADQERVITSVAQGAQEVLPFIDKGDFKGALSVLEKRKERLASEGKNTDDTQEAIDAIVSGDAQSIQTIKTLGESAINIAQTRGLLDPSGVDPNKARSLDIRERELDLKTKTEERQSNKFTAISEKALLDAQENVVSSQRSSNEFRILADQYEDLDIAGGLASSTSETFKKLLGSQDDVTEFRRRFNKVRLSEGLKNLPPGPATDRDVIEAFKGVPPENAPAKQVASFLRGAARLSRLDAAYNQFKADFISENTNTRGMNKEWRRVFKAPAIDRAVSMAEIYETAQNRGVTPEDVKQRLGIR